MGKLTWLMGKCFLNQGGLNKVKPAQAILVA